MFIEKIWKLGNAMIFLFRCRKLCAIECKEAAPQAVKERAPLPPRHKYKKVT